MGYKIYPDGRKVYTDQKSGKLLPDIKNKDQYNAYKQGSLKTTVSPYKTLIESPGAKPNYDKIGGASAGVQLNPEQMATNDADKPAPLDPATLAAQVAPGSTPPVSGNYAPGANDSKIVGSQYYDQKTGALNQAGQNYKAGLAQTMASGAAVPPSMGGAAQTIQDTIPPPAPDTSVIDIALAEDKGWQGLTEQFTEYFSPENQKVSLMDTYNKLFKKSGLDQLDEEIIDAKTIIEGTEDDIRNEIEQAGGFGSDSQVQALALSRNKVLLKNYNNLVAMRESKANSLDTMMSFAEKDRAYADSQFDRMLNYQTQMMNYRDKFIQNARDQYNKYSPQQLQAMLAGNPRQLAFAEDIMGVGRGGLEKLALYVAPLSEMDKLDMEVKRANIRQSNASATASYASAAKTKGETGAISGASPYQAERALRTVQSVNELGLKAMQSPSIFGKSAALPLPGFLRGDAYRNFKTELDTLKANIAFGELTAMREASKTGGALGSIANQELQLLESTLGGLNMTQSAENFQLQLQKVKQSVNRWQSTVNGTQTASQPTITAPDGTQVIITD